ncbi:MAG: enhanced serine sensitivity protein SseB C-terminal domain-containing protein, partial [Holdemanella sp.]|nr:enhanced serine sensitivity protein SseB C-terminal domain-containing protein [Holdemanella sp.]
HTQQKTFEEGEVLTLKEPENADEFISIIKETSKEVEEIKSIYLKERDGYWFIIVDAENESVELFQKLGRMWTPYAMGKQMQFLFASVPACEDILKFSRPVYRK